VFSSGVDPSQWRLTKLKSFWFLAVAIFLTAVISKVSLFTPGMESVLRNPIRPLIRSTIPNQNAPEADAIWLQQVKGKGRAGLNAAWVDSIYYENLATGKPTLPPFRHRVLVPALAGVLSKLTGIRIDKSFVALNVLFSVAASLLLTWFCIREFGLSKELSLVGGIIFIALPANDTIALSLIDPAVHFFSIALFIAAVRGKFVVFLLLSIAAIFTKEVFLFASVLWLFCAKDLVSRWKLAIGMLVPVVAYLAIRIGLGGEMGYDFETMSVLASRMITLEGVSHLVKALFLSFGFLWLGLINFRHAVVKKTLVVVPVVMIAVLFLAIQVVRPMGVLFPVVIPAFLLLFKRHEGSTEDLGSPT
jgi:hypothetical protein